ncbi:pro-resilin-like [Portunus trituberculatus]|uniref:pro-resilin-like n=1 Tax=Portunus trituberculatus TaxID=210409 RepID=UPI001E1CBDE8|nr:pro-resilin-like [Portunus trituberculatus]
MIKIAASCLLLAGVVLSKYSYVPPSTPSVFYSVPSTTPPTTTPPRSHTPMEGMPYDFQYVVQDPESSNTYSHVENSNGKTTQGQYRVLLPDGRTQVVTFYDNGDGFNADVTYI